MDHTKFCIQMQSRMSVAIGLWALLSTMVSCARSQDSLLSVSVCRVHVVNSSARFKGGSKACIKTHETAALRRDIRKGSRSYLGLNPSHRKANSVIEPTFTLLFEQATCLLCVYECVLFLYDLCVIGLLQQASRFICQCR